MLGRSKPRREAKRRVERHWGRPISKQSIDGALNEDDLTETREDPGISIPT